MLRQLLRKCCENVAKMLRFFLHVFVCDFLYFSYLIRIHLGILFVLLSDLLGVGWYGFDFVSTLSGVCVDFCGVPGAPAGPLRDSFVLDCWTPTFPGTSSGWCLRLI